MSDSSFDCVSCGACCFSNNPKYLPLLNWDAGRKLPEESLFREGGATYVRFDCGHCTHLQLDEGKAVCGVYEDRPEACRAFRAGSFECVKARRANGIMGEKVRQIPVAEPALVLVQPTSISDLAVNSDTGFESNVDVSFLDSQIDELPIGFSGEA